MGTLLDFRPREAAPPSSEPERWPLGRVLAQGASRRARRYCASTTAPSGRLVSVAPSRVSWRADLFYVVVSGSAGDGAAWPVERLEGSAALRARLRRGGLDPDADVWDLYTEGEPEPTRLPAPKPAAKPRTVQGSFLG